MLNNRFAREALKQAATQVNQGVRDGARQFIEREITPAPRPRGRARRTSGPT